MPFSKIVDAHLPEGRQSLPGPKISAHTASPSALDRILDLSTPPDECARPHLLHHVLDPASLTAYTSPLDPNHIAQPLPTPPRSSATLLPSPLSPHHEDRLEFALDFAAGALPSTDVSLPAPPIVKTARTLRLPSFDALGIANPHPDRIAASHSTTPFLFLGAGPLSNPEDPLHARSPPFGKPHKTSGVLKPAPMSPEAARPNVERSISTLTPPAEPGTFSLGPLVNVWTTGVGSPPLSGSGASPALNTITSPSSHAAASPDPLSVASLGDALGMAAWTDRVKGIITSNLQPVDSDSVKVLSHALPCPSLTGHLFGQIIAGIHETSTAPTAWINVFHALPGRYTLFDLPKSPPSTPGPAVGGDEYFTSQVFDTAVAVADYQLDSKLLPPSPRPVVPPGSVNVSIVERYIPPTNVNEFGEMFKLNGSSLLYDRLIELSSSDGLLLFIYPTRTGGRTFMRDYLGPVLDPLLRTVTVVHDLSSNLGRSLGKMVAVEHLAEYETLRAEMELFLQRLGQGSPHLSAAPERRSTYTILHASQETFIMEREAWASDWWIKQEKSRVRELVIKHFRKKLPSSELTSNSLIQEILEGVAHREYTCPTAPRGVEVGVFIIKKSA